MKKYGFYIAAIILAFILLAGLIHGLKKQPRILDEHISYRYNDKAPYGYYAAYHLLGHMFPASQLSLSSTPVEDWSSYRKGSPISIVLVTPNFNMGDDELSALHDFIAKGNHVLVICNDMSPEARYVLQINSDELVKNKNYYFDDTLRVQLSQPLYHDNAIYTYPGKKLEAFLQTTDSLYGSSLGKTSKGYVNFFRYYLGTGSLSVHLAPQAFSNYFILYANNYQYLEKVFSVFPEQSGTIYWNDYYLNNRSRTHEKEPGWLSVLMKYPSFSWSLYTLLISLVIFALLEMRRRQRMIPAYKMAKNETLDFIKTLGKLYYEKGDHTNIARKMSVFFLEGIRMRFMIPTHPADTAFSEALHQKTGYALHEIEYLTNFVRSVQSGYSVSEQDLAQFYHQLEKYYQFTGYGRANN